MADEISKPMLKEFRTEFAKATKELQEKFGIVLDLNSITYSADSFTGKITARLNSVSPYKKLEDSFNALYHLYGLDKAMLGKCLTVQNRNVKFVGIDTKKRNYPCICVDMNDTTRSFKMSIEQLKYLASRG